MAANPDLLFFLRNKVGSVYHYYQVLNTGAVVLSPEKKPIHDPYNWKNLEMSIIRNSVYRGIVANDSLPVKFIGDGAGIIRHLYKTDSINAEAELYIEIKQRSTGVYYSLVSGGLDFSKYAEVLAENNDAVVVGYSVPVYDSGIYADIDAYKDVKVSLDLDFLNAPFVYCPGIRKNTQYAWYGSELVTDPNGDEFQTATLSVKTYLTINEHYQKGDNVAMIQNDIRPGDELMLQYLFTATRDMDCYVTGSFVFDYSVKSGGTTNTRLRLYAEVYSDGLGLATGAQVARYTSVIWEDSAYTAPGAAKTNVTASFNVHMPIEDGDVVFIYFKGVEQTPGGGTQHRFKIHAGWDINVNCVFRLRPTVVRAIPLYDAWKYVIQNVSNGKYTAQSDYWTSAIKDFDMLPRGLFIASGTTLRGLPKAKIVLTLDDLTSISNTLGPVAVGVFEDKLRVEKLNFFFRKDTVIADIGEVLSAKAPYPYENAFANSVEIGYPDVDSAEYDSRDEFNTTYTYKTEIRRSNNTHTFKSPAIAAHSVIDQLRVILEDRDSTSSSEDGSLFLLHTTGQQQSVTINGITTPAYPLAMGGQSVSGVTYPDTTYNIALSPKRCVRRKDSYFKSIFYSLGGRFQKMIFQGTPKSVALDSNLGAGQINEITDIDFAAINTAPLFKPYLFEVYISANRVGNTGLFWQRLKANPYGVIRFKKKGKVFEGFILRASLSPVSNEIRFNLLAAPSVNVEDFDVFDEVNTGLTWGEMYGQYVDRVMQ